ncbi:MAG: cation transporter [Verrucomicrobia subdivision 3 bacterium]|nr:cation transporter [Limisphaerales bacterium]
MHSSKPGKTVTSKSPASTTAKCPRCGVEGRGVSAITVASLVKPETLARLSGQGGFRFCATQECEVVYYCRERSEVVDRAEVRVPVFQKSASPERPVCYCFQHTVGEIENDVRATGASPVLTDIKAQCAKGLDACERNNPQGACCLGNVQRVLKEAQSRAGRSVAGPAPASHEPEATQSDRCCHVTKPALKTGSAKAANRAGLLAGIGAVVTAALASACCWLPLLIVFGVSTVGVAGFFETYRVWFLGGTAMLLATGFYLVYFRKPACAPGSACATPNPRLQRVNRLMLWTATAIVLAFALLPNYAGSLVGRGKNKAVGLTGPTMKFSVSGMTCVACAAGLEKELARAPGVLSSHVDYAAKTAEVMVAPTSATASDVIRERIEMAGYQAVLVQRGETTR